MLKQAFTVARIVFSISLLFAISYTAIAQDPSPTPTDEERRLEDEIRLLKLKKEKATLKNDIREAVLSPSATPLEGKAELTGITMEPQMMSYRAMSTTCNCIATRIHSLFSTAQMIVLYDPTAAAELKYYRFSYPIVEARLKGVMGRLEEAIKANTPGPLETPSFENNKINALIAAGVLPVAGDLMRSFADVLALFRTDTKIEGKTLSIDRKALLAEMQFALKGKYGDNIVLYDPGSFSPDEGAAFDSNTEKFRSKVLQSLVEGYKKRDLALELICVKNKAISASKAMIKDSEDKMAKLKSKKADLEAAKKKATKGKEGFQAKKDEKEKEIETLTIILQKANSDLAKTESEQSHLTALVKDFDALVAELVTINDKTGTNDLLTFLKAESLDLVLKGKKYYWLDIASVSAGGNNRTRKNLFRYIAGSKIDHSGGVILEWQLLTPQWQFADGGKTQVYEGYLTARRIRDNQVSFSPEDLTIKCGHPVQRPAEDKNLAKKD